MKILLRLILVLLFLNTTLYAQKSGAPFIQFEPTEYDFKDVQAESSLKYIFKFQNTGSDTLKILKVRPG